MGQIVSHIIDHNLSPNLIPLALVTGAARRVGRNTALHLASKGYAIGLHYNHSEQDACKTAAEIEKMGMPVFLIPADLEKPEEILDMFTRIDGIPNPLKILVNAAALLKTSNLMEIDVEAWDRIFDLNTRAAWLCSREAAKQMKEGGVILNISDVGASKNWTGYGAYVVSKSALEALTRVMARQLAPRVRVCGIAPGLLMRADDQSEEEWEQLIQKVPLKRAADQAEYLAALDFLIGNDYITGEIISLAGGYQLV